MSRRHEHPQRVWEVAVERDSGDVRESREPLFDLSLVQREQAAAPERRERLLYMRGDARQGAVDLDPPQSEERCLACAEIGERSSAEVRRRKRRTRLTAQGAGLRRPRAHASYDRGVGEDVRRVTDYTGQLATRGHAGPSCFQRGAFCFADRDHLSCVRLGQFASAG